MRGIHPPDPNNPRGMAFIMGAGFVDPRAGKTWADREPMALVQSWEPTSELWWQLGLRWHPELATKWLSGGGQFQVADIVNEKPVEPSLEQDAEEVLQFIAGENPEFAETLKRVKECGSEQEKAALLKEFEQNIQSIIKMGQYIKGSEE
jgi:hypothetical protein